MAPRGVLGMTGLAIVGLIWAVPLARPTQAQRADYPIRALPLRAVTIDDAFWSPRLRTNAAVTVPHIMRQNEATGRVANFARAARRAEGAYQGRRFNDTDVYKAIEAAAYVLASRPDPALERQVDDLIALIAAAQEPDGYLFPARTIDPAHPAPGVGPSRWMYENGSHELYNAGHLYEAAVAHVEATGKRTLLDVAVRNAALVRSVFGPTARKAAPGHEEIELALFRLARVTDTPAYAELARFFLDRRGQPSDNTPYPPGPFAMYNGLDYKQDHAPVLQQPTAVGHAVRGVYLYAGMTDAAAVFADDAYASAVERLWQDVVAKRMYVTGGIGSRAGVEAFGGDYELPNSQAYTETCAAIGFEQWNHRLFRLSGDAKYLDLAEQLLYNGLLSGVSQAGDTFFYQNPLESDGRRARSAYFDVACCPANLARTLAQLPGLIYAQRDDALFVGLFIGSRATLEAGGQPVTVTQETQYPWTGAVTLRVDPERPAPFTLHVRIPGWSRGELLTTDLYRFAPLPRAAVSTGAATARASGAMMTAGAGAAGAANGGEGADAGVPTLTVNGTPVPLDLDKGFARIRRTWTRGDVVRLTLPMPARRVLPHEGIAENRGKAAIQRGPLVYALEGADNDGAARAVRLPLDAPLASAFRADLLGGVTVITAQGSTRTPATPAASGSGSGVGAAAGAGSGSGAASDGAPHAGTAARPAASGPRAVTAIPYFAWANRAKGDMTVWIPY